MMKAYWFLFLFYSSCPVGEATHLWSYWRALANSARHNITSNKWKELKKAYIVCQYTCELLVCQCVNSGRLNLEWGKVKARKWVGSPVAALSLLLRLLPPPPSPPSPPPQSPSPSPSPSPLLPFCFRGFLSQVLKEDPGHPGSIFGKIKIGDYQHWWRRLESSWPHLIQPWSCILAAPSFTSSILGRLFTIQFLSMKSQSACVPVECI